MIRGTTAQYKFTIPYPVSELLLADVIFWQSNNSNELLPIKKTIADLVVSDNPKEFIVQLTAEETARFLDKYKVKMQLKAQHKSGTVFGTKPQLITVYPMPDDIAGGGIIPTDPSSKDGFVIIDGGVIIE